MIVVSNSSPLISLARLGEIGILQRLYGEIWIPQAVWNEIVIEGEGRPGAEEVRQSNWIRCESISNVHLVRVLQRELGLGESEAIVLAVEKNADLLIIDERLGRKVASYLGLNIIGVVGLLVEAKHRGIIKSVKAYLDRLQKKANFRISAPLYSKVLQDVGEL